MNGILIINKEKDYTSRDVVNILGKILHTKKIGHTGTLDPLAEGVLVCPIGKCTKLCDYFTSDYKEYIATMKFGLFTDTLDITGKILKTSNIIPTKEEVLNALKYFKGTYHQEVPAYSSVKINGKKLYEYARNNELIELPKRLVDIKEIELIECSNDTVTFKTTVSKGTYIRSLIRDIAEYLNTYATMTKLIRTKQGRFSIEESSTLNEIKEGKYQLLTLDNIFENYPHIEVDENKYKNIKNGQMFENKEQSDFIVYTYQNKICAIYQINKKDQTKIKPLILV